MADDSPFSFLDPSNSKGAPTPFQRFFDSGGGNGSIPQMVGRAFGVPGSAERTAALQADIFGKLSGLYQSTGSPQKAILQFVQTPQGQELMSRPGAASMLEEWTKTITPPAPTQLTTAPGNAGIQYQNGKEIGRTSVPPAEAQNMRAGVPQLANTGAGTTTNDFNPNNPDSKSVTQPTERVQAHQAGVPELPIVPSGSTLQPTVKGVPDKANAVSVAPTATQDYRAKTPQPQVQTFDELTSRMHNITPDKMSLLAQNSLNPDVKSQQSLAIQELVKSGAMTPQEGNEYSAGVLKVIEETKPNGELTGRYFITNTVKGGGKMITPGIDPNLPGQTVPTNQTGGAPHEIPPNAINPDGSYDPIKLGTSKKNMALNVGALGKTVYLGGVALRQVNPTNNEEKSQIISVQQAQMHQLETALSSVGAAAGGRLRTQTQHWEKMAPTTWTDPKDAYNKMGNLHQYVTNLISSESQVMRNRMMPKKLQDEAAETIQHLNNVLDAMPSLKDIDQMRQDIRLGVADVMTIPKAVGSVIDMGKDALKTIDNSARQLTSTPGKTRASPNAPDVTKMDEGAVVQYGASLPPGPSAERTSYENRIRQLIQERDKRPPGKRSDVGSNTQVAGDVLDRSGEFSNIQQSNAITRSLTRKDQDQKPKAPVLPMAPRKTARRTPFSQVA